jgi:hypothetical protein
MAANPAGTDLGDGATGQGRASADAEGDRPGSGDKPAEGTEKKWYIVHTYSGHENKAKLTLLERVRNANLTEYFG